MNIYFLKEEININKTNTSLHFLSPAVLAQKAKKGKEAKRTK